MVFVDKWRLGVTITGMQHVTIMVTGKKALLHIENNGKVECQVKMELYQLIMLQEKVASAISHVAGTEFIESRER